MNYLRGSLSAVAAVFGAWFVLGIISTAHTASKATGLAAVAGGVLESLLSPLFWTIAISLFILFFTASRLNNKPLRIFLFWTPVVLLWSVAIGLITLFTFLWLHVRRA